MNNSASETFFTHFNKGQFELAFEQLSSPEIGEDLKPVLVALVELYRGNLYASPATRSWERAVGSLIFHVPATIYVIEALGKFYSLIHDWRGQGKGNGLNKVLRRFMPNITHYRYTNFIKGSIQISFLRGCAAGVDPLWHNYFLGFRAHSLCILGRFDLGLKHLEDASARFSELIERELDPFRKALFKNYAMEIKTAHAFHNGYAGHIDKADQLYKELFAVLEREPSFFIEALAHSMRSAISLEMQNREWLREDIKALRRLFSNEKSRWWSLRASSYSALMSATEGDLDHASRLLQTCETYYKGTTIRFELMRYHFVRALIELEFGQPNSACRHARMSRNFVHLIPGAHFHQAESIIHDSEINARAMLSDPNVEKSRPQLRKMKQNIQKARRMVLGCKTLEIKVRILLHLINHLEGKWSIPEDEARAIRNDCAKHSLRMLRVFNSFDVSGVGNAELLTRVNSGSNEIHNTSIIKSISRLAKESVSEEKVSEILRLLFAADSASSDGVVSQELEHNLTFQLREAGRSNLEVLFPVEAGQCLKFKVENPNFQLGFDTYFDVYLDLLSAILRQSRAVEVERRTRELQSRIEVYSKVAHDIRSPLSALNMFSRLAHDVDDEKKRFLNAAIKRINDIANDLLSQREDLRRENQTASYLPCVYLPYILETLHFEKTVEYHDRSRVTLSIEPALKKKAFVRCNPIRLRRILSNLVNNAVESGSSLVEIHLRGDSSERLVLEVIDSGRGIPSHIIKRLGREKISYGKESGHGIGILTAYESANEWGAELKVNSQPGQGTVVSLTFASDSRPGWYIDDEAFLGWRQIVLIDDDAGQAGVWKKFLAMNSPQTLVLFCETTRDAKKLMESCDLHGSLIVVDYDMGENGTGLEFILNNNLRSLAVLVTDNYDDPLVLRKCEKEGVSLYPKYALTKCEMSSSNGEGFSTQTGVEIII